MSKIKTLLSLAKTGVASSFVSISNKDAGRKYIIESISQMPGLPAKFGQYLNSKYGMQQLITEPLPLQEILQIIEKENPHLLETFVEIEESKAAASLGQVHRCTDEHQKKFAVKVQYPKCKEETLDQLDLMINSLKLIPILREFKMDIPLYQQFLKEKISIELNYLKELENQEIYYSLWENEPLVIIPRAYKDLSTEKVLVQDYIESIPIHFINSLGPKICSEAAKLLLEFQLKSIFLKKMVHADLWNKNFGFQFVDKKLALVVYDFGSVIEVNHKQMLSIKELILNPRLKHSELVEHYKILGFSQYSLEQIGNRLIQLNNILFLPFHSENNQSFNLTKWNLNSKLEELLGPNRWAFRCGGSPWFFYFLRSCQGIVSSLEALNVDIDFKNACRMVLGQFPMTIEGPFIDFKEHTKEKILSVEVMENNQLIVKIELPARSVENLEAIMPQSAIEYIHKNGSSLETIKNKAILSNY